jgi:hypothetical protein
MEFRAHEMGGSPCAANCRHLRGIGSVARIRGLENLLCLDTWGFARKAALHPRLYACACSAG